MQWFRPGWYVCNSKWKSNHNNIDIWMKIETWSSQWLLCFSRSERASKNCILMVNITSRCSFRCPSRCAINYGYCSWISGPLNRLNAILSLLHPLDRQWNPSAIGSAIVRPYLGLSRVHTQIGVLNRLALSHPRKLNHAIVVL